MTAAGLVWQRIVPVGPVNTFIGGLNSSRLLGFAKWHGYKADRTVKARLRPPCATAQRHSSLSRPICQWEATSFCTSTPLQSCVVLHGALSFMLSFHIHGRGSRSDVIVWS